MLIIWYINHKMTSCKCLKNSLRKMQQWKTRRNFKIHSTSKKSIKGNSSNANQPPNYLILYHHRLPRESHHRTVSTLIKPSSKSPHVSPPHLCTGCSDLANIERGECRATHIQYLVGFCNGLIIMWSPHTIPCGILQRFDNHVISITCWTLLRHIKNWLWLN